MSSTVKKLLGEDDDSGKVYGGGMSTEDIRDHYGEIMGEPGAHMTRDEMLAELKGTEFDEHAYSFNGQGGEGEDVALAAIEQAIKDKKQVTVAFGPNGLETIRNFIEKPHHQTNWRAVADLLAQAFIP